MGGPGSGRRPSRTAVHEARCLDIGELCDAGRLQAHPRGEVSWWGEMDDERRNWLRYRIGTRAADGERSSPWSATSAPTRCSSWT